MSSKKDNEIDKSKKRIKKVRDISQLPDWAILRVPEICDCLGCGKSTLYKKIADSEFPELIKIGERASGQTVKVTREACEEYAS